VITINVSGFLTDFTAGRHEVSLNGSPLTVREALTELWQMYPGLRDRVVNERGEVRQHVNVFVADENIRRRELLDTHVQEGAEITILPAVSGG
jgi:molybdopterin synthase sulfur carrier subunit